MPTRHLPVRPDLDQLRHQAKTCSRPANGPLVDLFFYGCIVLALPVVMGIAKDGWMRMKRHDFDGTILLYLTILCFFLVMPLSYLNWEKYFLPVLPVVLLVLLFVGSSEENHDRGGGQSGP